MEWRFLLKWNLWILDHLQVIHTSAEIQEVLPLLLEKLQAHGMFIHLPLITTGSQLEVTDAPLVLNVVVLKYVETVSMLDMLISFKWHAEDNLDIGQLLKYVTLVITMELHSIVNPMAGWKDVLKLPAPATNLVQMPTLAAAVLTGGKKESLFQHPLNVASLKTQDGWPTFFQT
jgi:hypothetical protein